MFDSVGNHYYARSLGNWKSRQWPTLNNWIWHSVYLHWPIPLPCSISFHFFYGQIIFQPNFRPTNDDKPAHRLRLNLKKKKKKNSTQIQEPISERINKCIKSETTKRECFSLIFYSIQTWDHPFVDIRVGSVPEMKKKNIICFSHWTCQTEGHIYASNKLNAVYGPIHRYLSRSTGKLFFSELRTLGAFFGSVILLCTNFGLVNQSSWKMNSIHQSTEPQSQNNKHFGCCHIDL